MSSETRAARTGEVDLVCVSASQGRIEDCLSSLPRGNTSWESKVFIKFSHKPRGWELGVEGGGGYQCY